MPHHYDTAFEEWYETVAAETYAADTDHIDDPAQGRDLLSPHVAYEEV